MSHHAESAIIAAAQASDALAEVLRYAQEGNAIGAWPFGESDPTPKFVEAVIRTAEIQIEKFEGHGSFQDEVDQLGQLIAACRKFLQDWV